MSHTSAFKMRPLIAAFITVTALAVSVPSTTPKAYALLPVNDWPAYVQASWSDMNRSLEALKEQSILFQTLKSIGSYTGMMVDNTNNGFANVIARLGKGEQDRQNLDQLEKSMPAQDTCGTLKVSAGVQDALCDGLDAIAALVSGRAGNNKMSTGGGSYKCTDTECTPTEGPPTTEEVNQKNKFDAKKVVDTCAGLVKNGVSLCNQPSLMFNPPGGTLDKDEYKAVEQQILIAGNVEKPVPLADASLKKDSPQFKRATAQDMRRENMRETAVVAQTNLLVTMSGTNIGDVRKKGEIETLQTYLDSRLGSKNWICEVTNQKGCADGAPYVPPAELEKRRIQMEAVMLYISLQSYKSQLRTEKYLSDLALMEIDPVGK
ncbi:hypothetical protein V0M98_32085 (plasmid) [Pseudomonas silesiensis]|uniref:hypothetical protein n=1 Tax=Pseudomonas silesiensis TaxID=1853130 RepID=UPI0030CC40E2